MKAGFPVHHQLGSSAFRLSHPSNQRYPPAISSSVVLFMHRRPVSGIGVLFRLITLPAPVANAGFGFIIPSQADLLRDGSVGSPVKGLSGVAVHGATVQETVSSLQTLSPASSVQLSHPSRPRKNHSLDFVMLINKIMSLLANMLSA